MDAPSITISEQDIENLWQWATVLGHNPILFSVRRGHVHARTEGNETEITKYGMEWNVPHDRTARYSASQFASVLNEVRNSGPVRFSIGSQGHLRVRLDPEIVLAPLAMPIRPKDAT